MKLDFNLQINQKQGLALTAQVQQAIKLLQMTNLEICEFVEETFQDNPFIEDNAFSEKNTPKTDEYRNGRVELDKSLDETPYKNSSEQSHISQQNQFESGDSYIPRSTVAKAVSEYDPISLVSERNTSLYQHCMNFCSSLKLTSAENVIAFKLIDELDPTGWICADLAQIASGLQLDINLVETVLRKLQSIEPAGLFARNLKECLILQAIDREIYCDTMSGVLDNLHLIGAGKFDLLKRRTGSSDTSISLIFKKIKSLDPKPGLQFDNTDMIIREPDLKVVESVDGWLIELNNSTLPDVKISKDYATRLTRVVNIKSDQEFIREKISEAKWLKNAITKRNDTMLKVGAEIIKHQAEFLEKGAEFIKPLILNDIAEAVGMHESTISRVTTGSLIQTPRGTLELKRFFSVGLDQGNGASPQSATSIRYRIKEMINQENPSSPISDDVIVERLSKTGINVARRTVAKYRKIENIPSSFARKRQNILAGLTS